MSLTSHTSIVYGVNLGTTDDGWWNDEADDDEDVLRAAYGFVPTVTSPYGPGGNYRDGINRGHPDIDRYHAERRAFLCDIVPVDFEPFGYDFNGRILVPRGVGWTNVYLDEPYRIDAATAESFRPHDDWDAVLAEAVEILVRAGVIVPEPEWGRDVRFDPQPGWFITSVYAH